MEIIEILSQEHQCIERMLKLMREMSYSFMEDDDFDLEDFYVVSDFITNYADKHHHKKEEDLLFKALESSQEALQEASAVLGMYIEHDYARMYNRNLLNALDRFDQGDSYAKLDIIANAISYTDLLGRHVSKENQALYPFSRKMISDKDMEEINRKALDFERDMEDNRIKYLEILELLEDKYM